MDRPRVEDQVEGLKHVWRYNAGDIANVAIWLSFCLAIIILCAVVVHLFAGPGFNPCGTLGCHLSHHLAPLHIKKMPGFPVYKGG